MKHPWTACIESTISRSFPVSFGHVRRSARWLVSTSFLAVAIAACGDESPETSTESGEADITAPDQVPAPGTAERRRLIKAIHAKLDPKLNGQANEFLVNWMKSENGFTFMQARWRGRGKAIDWKKTAYKDEVDAGVFDTVKDESGNEVAPISVLVKKEADGFGVLDSVVAPTDLSFAGTGYPGVPRSIYPNIAWP